MPLLFGIQVLPVNNLMILNPFKKELVRSFWVIALTRIMMNLTIVILFVFNVLYLFLMHTYCMYVCVGRRVCMSIVGLLGYYFVFLTGFFFRCWGFSKCFGTMQVTFTLFFYIYIFFLVNSLINF